MATAVSRALQKSTAVDKQEKASWCCVGKKQITTVAMRHVNPDDGAESLVLCSLPSTKETGADLYRALQTAESGSSQGARMAGGKKSRVSTRADQP